MSLISPPPIPPAQTETDTGRVRYIPAGKSKRAATPVWLIALSLLALVLASVAAYLLVAMNSGYMPPANEQGWRMANLTADEQAIFNNAISEGTPAAQKYIRMVQTNVAIRSFDPRKENPCIYQTASCFISGRYPDTIYYNKGHLQSYAATSVIWHELGHALDRQYLSKSSYRNIGKIMQVRSGDYWPISPYTNKNLPLAEVWAEQWTMWALNDKEYRSPYNVPPMLHFSDIDHILKENVPTN